MLDARSRQPSFFDTDEICKPLFPPESFWHRFRELIYPLINDEGYACLYCPDRGRPATSPALLTMVTILQRREDLSDREAEDRVRYDLRWKYALGLEVNDEGFWSLLKRRIRAIHTQVSRKYLDYYLAEASFRYNLRLQPDRLQATFQACLVPLRG